MPDEMLLTLGFVVVGVLLIVMTMTSSFISRLPLSAAMLYLAVGVGIGPAGLGLLVLDPLLDASLIERLTEIAVLISLFTAGLKLTLPLNDRRWRIPVQLASVSMVLTVGSITALGFHVMNLPLGAAVLLGAILAPTDPVLTSDVQVSDPGDRDRLRFGLTGEGGLNDGTAFPFVMLGLGLLSLHELGTGGWCWWGVDVLWGVAGGLTIGFLLGALVGKAILYLRTHHREALWFIPVLFLVIRPLAVYLGLLGTPVVPLQRRLIAWFGIRGIGSIYYLMYAITHELGPVLSNRLLPITLAVVVASILAHGVSVTPLMRTYERRKAGSRKPAD